MEQRHIANARKAITRTLQELIEGKKLLLEGASSEGFLSEYSWWKNDDFVPNNLLEKRENLNDFLSQKITYLKELSSILNQVETRHLSMKHWLINETLNKKLLNTIKEKMICMKVHANFEIKHEKDWCQKFVKNMDVFLNQCQEWQYLYAEAHKGLNEELTPLIDKLATAKVNATIVLESLFNTSKSECPTADARHDSKIKPSSKLRHTMSMFAKMNSYDSFKEDNMLDSMQEISHSPLSQARPAMAA